MKRFSETSLKICVPRVPLPRKEEAAAQSTCAAVVLGATRGPKEFLSRTPCAKEVKGRSPLRAIPLRGRKNPGQ